MLKDLLFKPRWMHKNPAVRERAVAGMDDARMIEQLPDLARNDPSPEVRLAALKRVTDMYHHMRQATDDDEESIRDFAYRTYRAMLSGQHEHSPALPGRLEIVPRLDDDALIEYLAHHAAETEIRLAAIEKINKAGLLGDLAINDPDRNIRIAAAARVTQPSTLERIAQGVRKTDKGLYRSLIERLNKDRPDSPASEHAEAEKLCLAMEALCRSDDPKDERRETLQSYDKSWAELSEDGRGAFSTRFQGARAIVIRALDGPTADSDAEPPEIRALRVELNGLIDDARHTDDIAELGTVQALLDRARRLDDTVHEQLGEEAARRLEATTTRIEARRDAMLAAQPVAPALLALAAEMDGLKGRRITPRSLSALSQKWQQEWRKLNFVSANDEAVKQRFQNAMERAESRIADRAQAHANALEQVDGNVEALESALDDGDLVAAAKAQGALLKTLKTIGRDDKTDGTEFKARLASARGRLNELRDWQHWANNKAREELCVEAENLLGSGLHPDAVKDKIKSLNAAWRALNDKEKLPGDDPRRMPAPALYRRFRGACDKAFEPAKAFFDKRAEVRAHHLDELTELAERIEAAAADKSLDDIKTLEGLVRDGRRSLRLLDGIPPRQRGAMSKRLREGANAVDALLEDHYQIVERRKERIIDEVEALDPAADLDAAINAAKDAQKRWKGAGRSRRNREQKLWKRFRAASDRVFAHLDEKKAEEKAENKARDAALDEMLASLESLLAVEELAPETASSEIRRLGDEWRQTVGGDRRRDARFRDLVEKIETRLGETAREQMRRDRAARRRLVEICQQLELSWFGADIDVDALDAEFSRHEGHDAAETRKRFEAAHGEPPADLERASAENVSIAQDLLVQLEFLAGVETPEAFAQQRMDYQVRRLSERMSGQGDTDPVGECAELERRWQRLGPMAPDQLNALNKRYQAATDAIDKMI